MSDLFEKSIRTLELPAVLELLARHAVSDEAKARCLRLRPSTAAATVEHLLDETDAAKEIGRASVGKECVRRCRSRWSPYH